MFKKLVFTGLFSFAVCCEGITLASDYDFSATPDYSYDSYKSPDTYVVKSGTSSSLTRRNYNSSSHLFSGNVMLDRSHSKSAYSPQPSGYNSQPAGSSSNYNEQHGSNSTSYRTYTYK